MKCLTHNQEYKSTEFCIYCGKPESDKMIRKKQVKEKKCKHERTKFLDSPCASFEECLDCGEFIHGTVFYGSEMAKGIRSIRSSF